MSNIKPALTAEEWAQIRSGNFQLDDIIARPFATIAVLNHTAPDDDPRKITRADMKAIEGAIDAIDEEYYSNKPTPLKLLQAKLAALLLPEADRALTTA
jgi:hypothetical protein